MISRAVWIVVFVTIAVSSSSLVVVTKAFTIPTSSLRSTGTSNIQRRHGKVLSVSTNGGTSLKNHNDDDHENQNDHDINNDSNNNGNNTTVTIEDIDSLLLGGLTDSLTTPASLPSSFPFAADIFDNIVPPQMDENEFQFFNLSQIMGNGNNDDINDSISNGSYSQTSVIFDVDDKIEEAGRKLMDTNQQLKMAAAEPLEKFLRLVPFCIPVGAFSMYDATARQFALLLDILANNKWYPVDGGQYQAKIITPAVNGIVVPTISILFATLIGTTISTLRQRQLDIRTTINQEAGQLRILQCMLDTFPNGSQKEKCRMYLIQYTSRLIAESHQAADSDTFDLSGMDSELNGVLNILNSYSQSNCNGSAASSGRVVSDAILGQAYGACAKLFEERSKRITALQSTFPLLHYMIIGSLSISICFAFLMVSNQELLVFLNAVQLRILWTMLVGTFSALAVVCYDLGNPFRGSYQIAKSVEQLHTIRLAMKASLNEQFWEPYGASVKKSKKSRALKRMKKLTQEDGELSL